MANISKNNKFKSNYNSLPSEFRNRSNLRIAQGPGITSDNNINKSNGFNGKPQVDSKDPQVRKLVYNMYRGLLDKKHEQANTFLETVPKARVEEDLGVNHRVQSMMRQQVGLAEGKNSTGGPPPPPPPPPVPGLVPHASHIQDQMAGIQNQGCPPIALAGAMMKDKKPFTYTPGGLDLSEIRSPRMQRRLIRNASCEGVKSSPLALSPPQDPSSPSSGNVVLPSGCAVQVLPMPGSDMKPSKFQGVTSPPPKELPKPKAQRAVCGPAPPPPPFLVGGSNTGVSVPPSPLSPASAQYDTSISNNFPSTNASSSPDLQPTMALEPGPSIPTPPPPPKPIGNNRRSSLMGITVSPVIGNLQSVLYEPGPSHRPDDLQFYGNEINQQLPQIYSPQDNQTYSPLSNGVANNIAFSPKEVEKTRFNDDEYLEEDENNEFYDPTNCLESQYNDSNVNYSQPILQKENLNYSSPSTVSSNYTGRVNSRETTSSQQSISRRQSLMDQIDSIEIDPQFQEKLSGKDYNSDMSITDKDILSKPKQDIGQNNHEQVQQIEPAINEPAMVKPLNRRSSVTDAGKLILPMKISVAKETQEGSLLINNTETIKQLNQPSEIIESNSNSQPIRKPLPRKEETLQSPVQTYERQTNPLIEKVIVSQTPKTYPQTNNQVVDSVAHKSELNQQSQQTSQLISNQTSELSSSKSEYNQRSFTGSQLSLSDPIPAKLTEETPFGKALASKENTPIRQFSYKEFTPSRQFRSGSLTSSQEILNSMASISNQASSSGSFGQYTKDSASNSMNSSSMAQSVADTQFSSNAQATIIDHLAESSISDQSILTNSNAINGVLGNDENKILIEKQIHSSKSLNSQQINTSTIQNDPIINENKNSSNGVSVQRVTSIESPVKVNAQVNNIDTQATSSESKLKQSSVLEAVLEQDSLDMKQPIKPIPDFISNTQTLVGSTTQSVRQTSSQKSQFKTTTPAVKPAQNKELPIKVKTPEFTSINQPAKTTVKSVDDFAPIRQIPVKEPTPIRIIASRETTPSRPLAREVGPHVGATTGSVPIQVSQVKRMPSPPPQGFQTKPNKFSMNRQASLPSQEPRQILKEPIIKHPTVLNNEVQNIDGQSISSRSSQVSPTTGLIKAPLPWMNSQRRESSAPPEFLVAAPKLQQSQQRYIKQSQQNRNLQRPNSHTMSQNPNVNFQRTNDYQDQIQSTRTNASIQQPSVYKQAQPSSQFQSEPFILQQPQSHLQSNQFIQQAQTTTTTQAARERIIPITLERETTPPSSSSGYSSTVTSPPTLQQNSGIERIIPISLEQDTNSSTDKLRTQTLNRNVRHRSAFQSNVSQQSATQQQSTNKQQNRHSFQQYAPANSVFQPQVLNSAPVSLAPSHTNMFSTPTYPTSTLDNVRTSGGAFVPYNTPSELSSSGNALEALQQMQQNLAQLNSGLQNAFPRVIQQKMSDTLTPRSSISSNQGPQQPKKSGITGEVTGTPVQSRSFRVLQNVLDTHETPDGVDPTEPLEEYAAPEPKKYMGGNIPSRSFKMLQAMTDDADDVAGPGQTDL